MRSTVVDNDIKSLWQPEPGYLDTATYGLPPSRSWNDMQAALQGWRAGRTPFREWAGSTDRARETFARIIGVDAADVAVGAQVSQMLAPVAAALPDGATVLVPDLEFTSAVFPWAVHADRSVTVRSAPFAELPDRIDADTDVVSFALVQSATGEVADYGAIVAAARAANAMVVVDASQACGWLPFDGSLADVVVVSAYKWLMSPRGTGCIFMNRSVRDRTRPLAAGWFAGADINSSYYGLPLRLADDARAFDISPAWLNWVATAPALELVERIGVEVIHRHNVDLANRFLAGLGLPAGNSAVASVAVGDAAAERLAAAGIRASTRNGRMRASFHVYTTEADVDAALEALT